MSGRINITVSKDVHTAVRIYCVANGKTMAEVVADALRRLLADEQRKTTPTT
jgi:hypothetical protein